MGDMKAKARGAHPPQASDEVDPFADLADMFESEIGRAALAAHPGSAAPAFDAEFADALAADFARPAASAAPGNPYQGWIAPRPVRLTDPMEDGAAYASVPRSPLALQSDLEEALRGLSAPANPRHSIVVETQSFAPERVVDEPIEETSVLELDDFDELIQSELAVMHRHDGARSARQSSRAGHPAARPLPAGVDYAVAIEDGDPSGAYVSGYETEMDEAPAPRRRLLSRGLVMLGGSVAALALVGLVGFSLMNRDGGVGLVAGSGEPPLIKADTTPFKSIPKDPGGRSIPNQNKAVYERVASPAVQTAPTQQALLRESEEPIELPEETASADGADDNDLPGVELIDNEGLGLKDEARVETAAADLPDPAPVPVLQPRRVRTMVVRPDGTIVPAEAEASAPTLVAASAAPSLPAAPRIADQPALIEIASNAPSRAAAIPGATALVEEPAAAVPQPASAAEALAVAPRGVDPTSVVPVQVADPIEVAAIAPAPAAPEPIVPEAAAPPAAVALPSGGYFVQISSQPSEALAQSSLKSLGGKFAGVIEGRSVGIQPADIPGKGTFYRVRIAAESKSEASSLCNRLKAAGGNCFVAR